METANITAEGLKRHIDDQYAARLQFLWEQYNKAIGLGILASTSTLFFLLKVVLFSDEVRELTKKLPGTDPRWLMYAIVFSGLSAMLFVATRWSSQILMERQVYGDHAEASAYFFETLEGETIRPVALELKKGLKFIGIRNRVNFLEGLGVLNEVFKIVAILLALASWICGAFFMWPFFELLVR